MSRSQASGHFIRGGKGPIFVLLREPLQWSDECVLVVPPFAEEMNKARRMVTQAALGLAARGIATLVPDLYGTGDSGGDFAEGDWSCWESDLVNAADWARDRGYVITGLLAIRLGAALACSGALLNATPKLQRLVLWQPVFDSRRFLAQFIRLRIAAALIEEDKRESQAELRARLRSGEILEVAGYRLSARLAADLDALVPPARLPSHWGRVHWMQVVRDVEAQLPSPSAQLIERTRVAGGAVAVETFLGEPFWTSTEIVTISTMITATIEALWSRAGHD